MSHLINIIRFNSGFPGLPVFVLSKEQFITQVRIIPSFLFLLIWPNSIEFQNWLNPFPSTTRIQLKLTAFIGFQCNQSGYRVKILHLAYIRVTKV